MKRSASALWLALIFIVSAAAAVFVVPKEIGDKYLKLPSAIALYNYRSWRLGLDLVGGTALVYDIDLTGIDSKDHDDVAGGLREVVEKRINQFGVAEPKVTVAKKGEGKYQLLVELAGVKDLKDAVKQIGETPSLDFRTVKSTETDASAMTVVQTGLTDRYIKSASVEIDQYNRPVFNFELNGEGAKIFEEVTGANVGRPLCIFVDNNFIFPDNPSAS